MEAQENIHPCNNNATNDNKDQEDNSSICEKKEDKEKMNNSSNVSDSKDLSAEESTCRFCPLPSAARCPHCPAGLCGAPACASAHRPLGECFPVRVAVSAARGGRHMLATRTIRPYELVLSDASSVFGPNSAQDAIGDLCAVCLEGGLECLRPYDS